MGVENNTTNSDFSFAATLRNYREDRGRSRNSLGHEIGVDPSYITRLENGDREPPRVHIVNALAGGLQLDPLDRDVLYMSAGYLPPSLQQIIPRISVILEIARVLSSELPDQSKNEFATAVQLLARRWIQTNFLGVDNSNPIIHN